MKNFTRAVRLALARAMLTQSYVPRIGHVALLRPDKQGRIQNVSRLEAQERGLPVYVSTRLSVLDKLFELQTGGYGVIRHTCNGCTGGQLRFQRQNKLEDEAQS